MVGWQSSPFDSSNGGLLTSPCDKDSHPWSGSCCLRWLWRSYQAAWGGTAAAAVQLSKSPQEIPCGLGTSLTFIYPFVDSSIYTSTDSIIISTFAALGVCPAVRRTAVRAKLVHHVESVYTTAELSTDDSWLFVSVLSFSSSAWGLQCWPPSSHQAAALRNAQWAAGEAHQHLLQEVRQQQPVQDPEPFG